MIKSKDKSKPAIKKDLKPTSKNSSVKNNETAAQKKDIFQELATYIKANTFVVLNVDIPTTSNYYRPDKVGKNTKRDITRYVVINVIKTATIHKVVGDVHDNGSFYPYIWGATLCCNKYFHYSTLDEAKKACKIIADIIEERSTTSYEETKKLLKTLKERLERVQDIADGNIALKSGA